MNAIKPVLTATKKIIRIKMSDEKKLDLLARHSNSVMRKYANLYKSKTLEELYTDKFKYTGFLPNATYIKKKSSGKRTLMFISSDIKQNDEILKECYEAKTKFFTPLGQKSFGFDKSQRNKMFHGFMESYHNDKYSGTQIRLTQVQVERAMAMGQNSIPLYALAEALPFHTMMGFMPSEFRTEVKGYKELKKLSEFSCEGCVKPFASEVVPIVHKRNGKYYFDHNQTIANAILKGLKNVDNTTGRKFSSIYPADAVWLTLSGKNFEVWKQRALSQPILKETKEMVKNKT